MTHRKQLNTGHDEIAGDNPEIQIDRVKVLVSEATTSSHVESVITHERIVERIGEPRVYSPQELKIHAMNYALHNTYVIEHGGDVRADGKTPVEYANAAIEMAETYLAWLKS